MKKREGLTLVEIIIVLVILAILAVVGLSANAKQVAQSRINATAQQEQLFATDMDRAFRAIGSVNGISSIDAAKRYLEILEEEITFEFNMDTALLTANGFTAYSKDLLDGFGQPFFFAFSFVASKSKVIMSSSGKDMKFSTNTYSAGKFEDDIIIMIKER